MKYRNYTISMMFRPDTHWNVYAVEDARQMLNYVIGQAKAHTHYAILKTAMLAQHQELEDGIALPLKIVLRVEDERKHLKKRKEDPSKEYQEVLDLVSKRTKRATNGEEILRARLQRLGVAE